MQVTETLSEGLKRSYAVRVPAEEIDAKTRTRLADIGKTLRLPGFRPGKVPANLVRQRYGNAVMAEVMQDAVSDVAERVIEDGNLRPAGQPRIAFAREPKIGGEAEDLELTVDLELLPEIAMPDLGALELTRYKAEVADDTLTQALEGLAKANRTLEDVTDDRPAEDGDVLVVDYRGTVDGTAFEGGTAQDQTVEVGGQGFIPGFTEQLAGMKPGETKTIAVTFPDPYASAELAGKAAEFEITAKALKKPSAPAQDGALASQIGFEDFESLKAAVRERIQQEYDQLARLKMKRELLDKLSELARFETPQGMLNAEFEAIWRRVATDRAAGQLDDEDRGKDEETLMAEYRAIADRRVRLGLLLSEIGRAARVEVTPAEISAALRQEAARYPGQEMQVIEFFRKNQGAIEQIRGPLFEDKVVDHILTQAKVEEKTVAPEELSLPGTEGLTSANASVVTQAGAAADEKVATEAEAPGAAAEEPATQHAAEPNHAADENPAG